MCVQLTKEQSAKVIEATIREKINKPKGVLAKADFEKVALLLNLQDQQLTDVKGLEKLTQLKKLHLGGNQLSDTKGLEKLTKLRELNLEDNPALTKAQIDQLQKALPKCKIYHDAKK
ncbi:MAG: leucine-rich repeat domain-containing protein [Verrucomicrobiales bacterium]|nr:leucine-rich repeat domain-containing protein [Verrucomicrobiales bacterium]